MMVILGHGCDQAVLAFCSGCGGGGGGTPISVFRGELAAVKATAWRAVEST